MKVFARVVDEGGFAKAARALDMAPPVVTRLVAELETHPVRAILEGVEEAQALTSQATKALSGHLGVRCPPAILVHQLAKLLSRFQADYPQLTLELSSPSPVETVDPAFDVTTFASRPMASSSPAAWRAPRSCRRARRSTAAGWSSTAAGMGLTRPPRASSCSWTCTPPWPPPTSTPCTLRRWWACMPSPRHLPARTRAFVDFLLQVLGGGDRDPGLSAAGGEAAVGQPNPA